MQKANRLFSPTRLISLSCAFVIGTMAAPLAAKWGYWHFSAAFSALKFLFYIGSALSAVGLIAMIYQLVKHGKSQALPYALTIVICSVPLTNMLYQMSQVKALPYIHDITTDTETPPPLLVAKALRSKDDNSTTYQSSDAAQQRKAYPDILPVYSILGLAKTLALVELSLAKLGYDDINTNVPIGQLEFSDQTFWFGFIDDVVIRVSREQQQTRIDIRSASRVGKSDIGKNAKRVRKIIEQLNQDLTTD